MDMLPMSLLADNGNSLQQLALLAWLRGGDEYKGLLEAVVAGRICLDVWQKLTGRDKVDAYRTQAILSIAQYIKEHPRASELEIQKFVKTEINMFKEKIEST